MAARLADLLRPLTEPDGDPGYPLMRETGDGTGPVYVDVELTVPRDRLAEFHSGYPEVVRRMAAIPGYRREQLLREPGSDIHHILPSGTAPRRSSPGSTRPTPRRRPDRSHRSFSTSGAGCSTSCPTRTIADTPPRAGRPTCTGQQTYSSSGRGPPG
ncbi:hypothetical protein V2I01_34535 [Micromonospora sp. BRA006-A]|nr:hypothetical protein [Micromonospora sp. BRA006-A]